MKTSQSRPLAALVTTIALAISSMSAAVAGPSEDAIAATVDLYKRMTMKDAPAYLAYRPKNGYSSFNPDNPNMQVLDPAAFHTLFRSDIAIKVHAEDLKAREFGNAVLVTGTRIGYMAKPDQPKVEKRYALTMLWSKEAGQMKLQHVHYSPSPEKK